jgi:hypothetical protein
MAGHVIDGDLVGNSLKAEIIHQPVEQGRAVVAFNGGAQSLITKFFEQVERASEAADLVNEANGIIQSSGVGAGCLCRRPTLNVKSAGDHWQSNQRNKLALDIGVAIDVPLGRLDRLMPGQELHIA